MMLLNEAAFDSAEEDADEDYVDSGGSEDEDAVEDAIGSCAKSKKRKNQQERQWKQDAQVEDFYQSMMSAYEKSRFSRTPSVSKDDFMLVFQRRQPRPLPKNKLEDIDKLISTSLSHRQQSLVDEKFSIAEFKRAARGPSSITASEMQKLLHFDQGSKVAVKKNVRFAGQVISVQRTLDRDSTRYKRHRKAEEHMQVFTGELHDLAVFAETVPQISTVAKSQTDWMAFVESNPELDGSLRQNRMDGFLSQQAFLNQQNAEEYQRFAQGRAAFNRKTSVNPREM